MRLWEAAVTLVYSAANLYTLVVYCINQFDEGYPASDVNCDFSLNWFSSTSSCFCTPTEYQEADPDSLSHNFYLRRGLIHNMHSRSQSRFLPSLCHPPGNHDFSTDILVPSLYRSFCIGIRPCSSSVPALSHSPAVSVRPTCSLPSDATRILRLFDEVCAVRPGKNVVWLPLYTN